MQISLFPLKHGLGRLSGFRSLGAIQPLDVVLKWHRNLRASRIPLLGFKPEHQVQMTNHPQVHGGYSA